MKAFLFSKKKSQRSKLPSVASNQVSEATERSKQPRVAYSEGGLLEGLLIRSVAYCTGERKTIKNNIINKGGGEKRMKRSTEGTSSHSFSLKGGGHPFYILLSVMGVLIGISLVLHGMNGGNLSPGLVLVIGLFVVIKEVLDIFH